MRLPIGWIAAAVAVPVVYGLLRRLFPVDGGTDHAESKEALQREFGKWLVAGVLAWLLVLTPALTWGFCALFVGMGRAYVMKLDDFDLAITPHWLYWSFLAFFIAMLCGALALDLLFRLLLRRRYARFIRFQELHSGVKARSQWLLLPLLALPCAIGVVLMLNWYVALGGEVIVINRLWSSEAVHGFDDIREIRTAPQYRNSRDDDVVQCRTYEVSFRDGSTWTTRNGPTLPRDEQWARFVAEVSGRSGVTVTELETLE